MAHGSIADEAECIASFGSEPRALNHDNFNHYFVSSLTHSVINWLIGIDHSPWLGAGENKGIVSLGSEPWTLSHDGCNRHFEN